VKASANKTAKSGNSAAVGAQERSVVVPAKVPAAKAPAKTASQVVVKPAIQSTLSVAEIKKSAVSTKSSSSQPSSPTANPAVLPAKPDNQTVAKSAVKPAAKTAAKVAAQLPAKPTVTVEKTAVKIAKTPAKTPAKTARSAPAPVIVEPTPRPLGKRAAKKVMMEQMTQAAVVPTHAPDAAKATFSTMNERAVMTPPVPSSIQKDPTRADNWKSLSIEQMTDQDVLAMPDSEYMSDLQLAYFRRKLSQLKADMLANAGETTEHLREDTVVVPDPADRATIEEEHALELRTRDRERKLLKKIEQAIARIDAGDYGYCEETGEVIGVGRLMARPTASLSLEAQQRRELKQKMFGD
jgi:DnaK suppressor protein